MKYALVLDALLIASAFASTIVDPADHHPKLLRATSVVLLDERKEHHRSMCSTTNTFRLQAGGGNPKSATDIGYATITTINDRLQICLDTTNLGASPALVSHVHVHAGCDIKKDFPITKKQGNPIPGKFDINLPYADLVDDCVLVDKPNCKRGPVLVAIHLDVTVLGGMHAVNYLFPQHNIDFELLPNDNGAEPHSSYWNAIIPAISPTGELNGYCVDTQHTIGVGMHTGSFYSYQDEDSLHGIVDMPHHLDAVAWLINNWHEGQTYEDIDLSTHPDSRQSGTQSCGVGIDTRTITSCDIQKAVWRLIDDDWQETAGLHSFRDDWACHMAEEALVHVGKYAYAYEPGCGNVLPVVMVPDNTYQRIIGQATFAQLRVPCVGQREETAWAVMGQDEDGFTKSFPGKNWATYVEYSYAKCA